MSYILSRSRLLFTVCSGALAVCGAPYAASANSISSFTAGDIVVSVEGNGSNTGNYLDNQAAPITLYEYGVSGTSSTNFAGSLLLPQTATGNNAPVSGEYGSSSEGMLQLSGNDAYLTVMGYAVNATSYNSNYDVNGTGTALAQSPNDTGSAADVGRVAVLIGANGGVNSSTVLTNVFNGNNPRSVATVNGTSFYISGQGQSGDTTEGLFHATLGSTTATAINTSYDARLVEIYNGQLYVSQDSKVGAGQLAYIAKVGSGLPTGATSIPTSSFLISSGSKKSADPGTVSVSGAKGNNVNGSSSTGIYLSPEEYFFANSTTLYVADSGDPKAGGLGDGGLQKWSLVSGKWVLDYTLSAGLDLVADTNSDGVSGLEGLTGQVEANGTVELYATSYTLGDTDQSYLYGITDVLNDTLPSQVTREDFTTLAEAPADSNFKGVAFAPTGASPLTPVPEPNSLLLLGGGAAALGLRRRNRNRN